jgi:pyruvate formate lyase activating enzyme
LISSCLKGIGLATAHRPGISIDNNQLTKVKFVARAPLIPGVNDNEDHIRTVLAFIRPYKNVIDYELLPYHRFGETKYGFLGRVYELEDFTSPAPETMRRLQAMIDEAFGRPTGVMHPVSSAP